MSPDHAFSGVPAALVEPLRTRGFTELTEVQQAVGAPGLAGRDLRISSQTGSGKTVALGFVIAEHLTSAPPSATRGARPPVVVIAPTRELAAQIGRELSWLFAQLPGRVAVVTGGTAIHGDFKALRRAPALVIGTPGRLVDHLELGTLDLSTTSAVVLDEADEMLDMGFRDELEEILEQLPEERNTHLVSATFPREVKRLADRYQRDAIRVEGTAAGKANTNIEHVAHWVYDSDKPAALINILLAAQDPRTLVFVRTRAAATEVSEGLARNGFASKALSGELSQRERDSALQSFRAGTTQVLVATDVAARGLDIDNVGQVIHFDLPDNSEAMTHRSGRTGRAGRKGKSIAIVPKRARQRAEKMFHRAKINVSWQKVPDAAAIRELATESLATQVVQAAAPEPASVALAERLLGQCDDPRTLIATLIESSSYAERCEPREINDLLTKPGRSKGPRSSASSEGEFASFQVSWGTKHGANPRKVLAMVCRRGDVRGDNIGAIRLEPFSAMVEVSVDVAKRFHQNVQQPDPRNPKVRIRPWQSKQRAHRGAKRAQPNHGKNAQRRHA